MRVVHLVLFCVILLSIASAAAQENASRDFRLQFYTDYCNCDDDCGEFSSCLSDQTDLFIRNMNSKTDDKISEAEEEGYNGICTAVTVDGELMMYSMTDECVVEEPETDLIDETLNASDEISDETTNQESSGNTDETAQANNRVITIDFSEQNGVHEEDNTYNTDKTGGLNMDLITGAIMSGTIVLVGFFALMAWMAYLLQKKAVDAKPKK